jgi:predicted ribosome quality control (RQC) complex YloA/Tae2 family protein
LARLAVLELDLARQFQAAETGPPAAPPTRAKERHRVTEPKETKAQALKRKDGKGAAYRSVMVEGFEVLIGKGDADNDALTFKVGAPLDFWMHVASVPGSHVIVRNPDKLSELPREVLERAAQLAAWHSKARDGGKVEVHVCRVADVSKPRGFAPGKVLLRQFKGLRVYPRA